MPNRETTKEEARRRSNELISMGAEAAQGKMLYDLVELVVDQMGGICIVVDGDGIITYANHVFCMMVGIPRISIVNTPFPKYVHPDDLQKTIDVFSHIDETGLPEPFLNRYKNGNDWQWICWSATPAEWRFRRVSVGWLVDGAEDPLIKRIKKFGKLA